MGYPVKEYLDDADDSIYTTTAFMRQVEASLDYLRTQGVTHITPEDHVAYKNEGDFFALLTECGVPSKLHWVTLRVNGLTNPSSYVYTDTKPIIIPDQTKVELLREWFIT